MSIICLHGRNIEIDDEMVSVVMELNKVGLKTISSCAGHNKAMTCLTFDAKDVQIYFADGKLALAWKR